MLKMQAILLSIVSIILSSSAASDDFKYPCPVKWKQYNLNDDPVRYGIKSGIYQPSDQAYIGRGYIKSTLTYGRIKVDEKPGFYSQMANEIQFNGNSNEIWYLAKNPDCRYSWADPNDPAEADFVIDIGDKDVGLKVVLPRYSKMPPMKGGLFYGEDAYAALRIRNISYQYMTCRSQNPVTGASKRFNQASFPPIIQRTDDSGCKHTWKFFKNNKEPLKNGINAGLYSHSNPAFVGMTKVDEIYRPSRIQITSTAGSFVLVDFHEKMYGSASYYLLDDPSQTYYWADAVGNEYRKNSVTVRQNSGPFSFPIGRAVINGRTVIGLTDGMGGLIYPDENGNQHVVGQYQVLVCDAIAKYKCVQKWKPYNLDSAPSVNGFLIGSPDDNIQSFIGRSVSQKEPQHVIGRIQISPKPNAGFYYFNSQLKGEIVDRSSNVEYLVKNQNDNYEWISSSAGKFVKNALKNENDGKLLIGKIQFDDKVYIGAVKANEGLIFVDYRGQKQVSRNYEVLTCSSAVYNDDSDDNFDECGARM